MSFYEKLRRATAVLVATAIALGGCAGQGKTRSASTNTQGGTTEVAESTQSAAKSVGGLKQDGVLTVGIHASTAPFVVGQGSSMDGLDVELAAALADTLGVSVSFKRVSSVADALKDSCDVVMDVGATDAEGIEIVGSYAGSGLAFFHQGESTVVSADDLTGKKVGVQLGSASQAALLGSGVTAEVTEYPTLNEAFDALDTGDVDFVLCHVMSGSYLAHNRKGDAFAGTLGVPASEGVAVSAGELSDAVREAYATLEANGVLTETCRRWLGDLPKFGEESKVKGLLEAEQPANSDEAASYEAEYAWVSQKDGSHAGQNAVTSLGGSSSSRTSSSDDDRANTGSGSSSYSSSISYNSYNSYTTYNTYTDYSDYDEPGYGGYSDDSGYGGDDSGYDGGYSGGDDAGDYGATSLGGDYGEE